jgi:hypothetical protein
MIRCATTLAELEAAADLVKPGWRVRAATRTQNFAALGRYEEVGPIWSEIKDVFIDLQREKCAFCERKLESKKEYDVEHFRPKTSVSHWSVSAELAAKGVVLNQPANLAVEAGYHLLAYHLLNYSVACAKCNSELKNDYFPISGPRASTSDDPISLTAIEKPLLVFPIGNFDEDPEDVIEFRGPAPQAKAAPGTQKHFRGLLTIAFFGLDDMKKRKELFRGRLNVIQKMGLAFMRMSDAGIPVATHDRCKRIIHYHLTADAAHTACGRCYAALWGSNPAKAEEIWNDAVDALERMSPLRVTK